MVQAAVTAAFLLLALAPVAEAGTREDPELRDASNDETRYPGVPTVEPSVDLRAIWFTQTETEVTVSMEVAQAGPAATPDALDDRASYAVYVFVNGEGEQTPCSGWGAFGVRWDSDSTGHLQYDWRHDGDGCPSERTTVEFAVVDNVITWTVPKEAVPRLALGGTLTVARAEAWSGSTWPATPDDRADQLPSRAYESAPVPGYVPTAANETADDDPVDDERLYGPGEAGPSAPQGDEKGAPGLSIWALLAAVAVAVALRRRA